MKKERKKKSIIIFFFIVFLSTLGMAAEISAQKTDIRGLVREYNEILEAQKKQGHDVSKAKELDLQSR